MSTEKNNISLRVLVAPLDWGLGHATRCIPLIQTLLQEGFEVRLAGSGDSGKLLAAEFPALQYDEIPSYKIRYASTKLGFLVAILRQLPNLFHQVRQERRWLKKYLDQHPVDLILSDNRYGLYHPSTYNVLITHQLEIRSGIAPWADRILQKTSTHLFKKFNVCWIPDYADYQNLSGSLGHPQKHYVPLQYIGPLTRFQATDCPVTHKKIVIVLSGPEPQRTLLEQKCVRELAPWDGIVVLVRGLPSGAAPITTPAGWQQVDHIPTNQLQQEIQSSEWMIARCGYSTLMDLSALKKKAVLIPTPGQPEQKYLADWISNQGLAHCIDQEENLLSVLTNEPIKIQPFLLRRPPKEAESNLITSLQLIRSLLR